MHCTPGGITSLLYAYHIVDQSNVLKRLPRDPSVLVGISGFSQIESLSSKKSLTLPWKKLLQAEVQCMVYVS